MVFHFLRGNHDACALPALGGGPSAERVTRLLGRMLRLVAFPGPPEPPGGTPLPSTEEECRTLLAYLQLSLGLVLPAVVTAGMEVRLSVQHAAQRRRAGLAPERGWWHRWLYGALADAGRHMDWVSWATLCWTVSCGLISVAGMLARSQAGG